MVKTRVNITLEKEIRDRAHNAGLNISRVAADAVVRTVQAIENNAGTSSAKITAPATTPGIQGAS